ncbi:hypothetical protein BP5796_09364 [Coleophoma crateriformis]|uniref:Peroxidase n=1 Tax=Coleophoma crateriformis TaxID=565419 RepID=A0A3D8QXX3_9HELO|nr:hypothetical protein BP5796_09364 [Coleophoma crateriformis]
MRIPSTIAVALATTFAEASVMSRAGGACPAVWTQVSQDLTKMFVQADKQCNDDARAAIRAVFHDCATWAKAQGNTGGCDGSLFLSAEENARTGNRGLQSISTKLTDLAQQRGVGVADMIAFAGAHATVSCPLGPTVKTMIGRTDSSNAAPDEGLLPGNASLSADTIITLFSDKGFSAPDVAALVGAHSSSKQFFVDPSKAGAAQDRTPGIWDVDFYNDTTNKPPGVFVFQSDMALSQDPRSGPAFKSFIGQQAKWNQAFADTFSRMMLLGVPTDNLVDCTAALPPPTDSFPGANEPVGAPNSPAAPGKPTAAPGKPTSPPAKTTSAKAKSTSGPAKPKSDPPNAPSGTAGGPGFGGPNGPYDPNGPYGPGGPDGPNGPGGFGGPGGPGGSGFPTGCWAGQQNKPTSFPTARPSC